MRLPVVCFFVPIFLAACQPGFTDHSHSHRGVWRNAGGTVEATCNGTPTVQEMLDPDDLILTITGEPSDPRITITLSDPPPCDLAATVAGFVATIDADRSCAIGPGTLTVKAAGPLRPTTASPWTASSPA